ncbi:MAG: hypothetical protein AB7K24_07590 [Gemmataceae bacterium]
MVQQASPAKQLAGFIAKFDGPIRRLVRRARARLRRRLPGAVELVYDNYNALAIGYGPNERASEAILSLAVYPNWVHLYFLNGAALSDPQKLLKGSGNQGRYLILESDDDMEDPPIRALITQAIKLAKTPLPVGRGYTVIKSISAKQRPRRSKQGR